MEYEPKNLTILISNNENRDWTRIHEAFSKKGILEDTIEGNFENLKDKKVLLVFKGLNICYLAEIIGSKSNQKRVPIPKPYLTEGEIKEPVKTKIKYKISEMLHIDEKFYRAVIEK
jgi:hypothetical protein